MKTPRWLLPAVGGGGALVLLASLALVRQRKGEERSAWSPLDLLPNLTGGGWKQRIGRIWSGAPPRPGRVLLIGDSIGAHGGFLRYLDAHLPEHTFQNQAVSGYSTGRMLSVAERYIRPGAFSEIIIEGHLNDGDRSSNWTKSNLRRLFQMARESGARVVSVGSTPWRGYASWSQAAQDRQDEVERWLSSGAEGLIDAFADVYDAVEAPDRPGHVNPELAGADHLHLNRAGQEEMGRAIFEQVYS
jgi:lysophospholipase L1-like esterase